MHSRSDNVLCILGTSVVLLTAILDPRASVVISVVVLVGIIVFLRSRAT